MADTTTAPPRTRVLPIAPLVLPLIAAALLLAALLVLNALFFARHAFQILTYPYPLDYGEGPLLAQVHALQQGTSLHQLYGPIDQSPYLVINYPPAFLLLTTLVSSWINNPLLAGRLISFLAGLACAVALFVLAGERGDPSARRWWWLRALLAAVFLALPIVREWSMFMRVDLLGVALGLWGLVAIRASNAPSRLWSQACLLIGALLLVASVFTKPSLLAAPAAALFAVMLLDWRRARLLAGILAGLSIALFATLAIGSHFFEHVVLANANTWEIDLALRFWRDQALIHAPLFVAGGLGVLAGVWRYRRQPKRLKALAMPIAYTLVGVVGAIGVGKVGAYANYFLELYAGLIWLAALLIMPVGAEPLHLRRVLVSAGGVLLVAAALLRYYPSWSEQYPRTAGLIEGENPPRIIVGQRGVWQDLQRERLILASLRHVNAALVDEVQAAGAPILSDIPAVAAQAGQIGRLQAFEHSQTMQLWDERDLRIDLANGRVPLAVIDYLGNWLNPDVIALLTHRYAQEGSRGTFDLYRPIAVGPRSDANIAFGDGLRISGSYLGPALSARGYQPGELLVVTLDWQADAAVAASSPDVTLQIRGDNGVLVTQDQQPLLYGAIRPNELGNQTVQDARVLRLPESMRSGRYSVEIVLPTTTQPLAQIEVFDADSALKANGWIEDSRRELVPRQFVKPSVELGAPLTGAVPFEGAVQQCFERGCLRLQNGAVVQAPIGEWLSVGDLGAVGAFEKPAFDEAFAAFVAENGGTEAFGAPITTPFVSGDRMVQYSRYARLERPLAGGAVQRGRAGIDLLRLPSGTPYRWP